MKVYEGETSRSARIRGAEHVKDLEGKKQKSVLFKHKMTDHKNENVKFQMKITNKFKDALTRQANEAVQIYGVPDLNSLNSKTEFNHPPINRVTIEKRNFVKKFPQKYSPNSEPSHQSNLTLESRSKQQCPGSFLFGTEDHLNFRTTLDFKQKQLSSEQEN